jgi:uncharacterized protein (DUF1697 family)
MPTNAKMPELKRAFEAAGFTEVRTLLGSGNVLFTAPRASPVSLQRKAEAAMQQALGRSFLTIIRPVEYLRSMLAADPFQRFKLKPAEKRVVTFLRNRPPERIKAPVTLGAARILAHEGTGVYTTYQRGQASPEFMTLIEKTCGKEVTTRTWETVTKAARL